MSLDILQNTFLELPLKNALKIYNDQVIPRLTKKNKVIAISMAVAISLVCYIQDRVFKPPRYLRHIPYIGYFSVLKSIIIKESHWDRAYRVILPKIDSVENRGLYLEPSRGGWLLQVSTPEDAKKVFSKYGKAESLLAKFVAGPNIVMLNDQHWKAQRKIANPAFRRSMPVKLFGKLTQEMFESMETMGDTINVSDLMERWTLDVIGKAGFDNEWVKSYNDINKGMQDPVFFLFPKLDQQYRWMFPKRVQVHKDMDTFLSMIDGMIETRRNLLKDQDKNNNDSDESEKDLLTLMIESENRGEGILSNEELKSNLLLFFVAGHDTTSNTLSFAIHYLAKYPEIQQKARREVISILGDTNEDVLPTIEDVRKMKYINQVMKETLRINGPIPRVVPRVASEDTKLAGYFIPKGTYISLNIFNIQHSEKVWKSADKFDPDRFAEDGGAIEDMTWLPFGSGARKCIGMNFSLNEQRVMLSMLLRKFTWTAPENSKHKNKVVTAGFQVIGPHELDMQFKKRIVYT